MGKKSKLNPAIQLYNLKSTIISSNGRTIPNGFTWIGKVHPSHWSKTYSLKISYHHGKRPKIWVIEPELDIPESKAKIHMFLDNSLCLHLSKEWNEQMLIANTILLWALEWLVFYEIWQITGKWTGGGKHLNNKDSK